MISDLGLPTRVGQEYFYPIFKNMQNWSNESYVDPFPTVPFTNKPKGENATSIYRERLVEVRFRRVCSGRFSNRDINDRKDTRALEETTGQVP